jgi:hypothetical protein
VKTMSEVAMKDSSPLQNASYARRNLAMKTFVFGFAARSPA